MQTSIVILKTNTPEAYGPLTEFLKDDTFLQWFFCTSWACEISYSELRQLLPEKCTSEVEIHRLQIVGNSLPNNPSTGCPVFIFTVRITSKSFPGTRQVLTNFWATSDIRYCVLKPIVRYSAGAAQWATTSLIKQAIALAVLHARPVGHQAGRNDDAMKPWQVLLSLVRKYP